MQITFQHESTDLSIDQIKPSPGNPRKRDKRSIREIAKSIKEFGFVQPIVIDENFNIIIGHGRYAAAKYLGFEIVPVIIAKNLTTYQRKQLQIADNRLSELSDWNDRLLVEMLDEMNKECPIEIPGFDSDELDKILGNINYQEEIDDLTQQIVADDSTEYHLLVSCTQEHYTQFTALRETLRKETWCKIEEASR